MLKRIFILLLTITLQYNSSLLQAQLLWQAVSSNSKDTVVLFGTMHFEEGTFFASSTVLTQAALHASCVVLETEMSQDAIASVMHYAKLPDSIKITDRLSIDEIKILDSLLALLGPLNTEMLNGFKPNFINIQLALIPLMSATDSLIIPKEPLDKAIQNFAIQNKKELIYLETDDFQLEMLFDKQPIDMQFAMLKNSLKVASGSVMDSAKILMNSMPDLYRRQQLDSLQQLILMASHNSPEEKFLYQSLLIERNANWINSIVEYCEKGFKPFIAVGAGHLPGSTGLIQLLRNRGFSVTPLKF